MFVSSCVVEYITSLPSMCLLIHMYRNIQIKTRACLPRHLKSRHLRPWWLFGHISMHLLRMSAQLRADGNKIMYAIHTYRHTDTNSLTTQKASICSELHTPCRAGPMTASALAGIGCLGSRQPLLWSAGVSMSPLPVSATPS